MTGRGVLKSWFYASSGTGAVPYRGQDAAQNADIARLEPRPAEDLAEGEHHALRVGFVEEADITKEQLQLPEEPFDLASGSEGLARGPPAIRGRRR